MVVWANIDIQRVRFWWLPALRIDLAEADAPADNPPWYVEHPDRRLSQGQSRSEKGKGVV
jgi:hypothetical protein